MAEDKNKYDVYKGLLNGEQVNTLSSQCLIKAVQVKTVESLGTSTDIFVLHDPCDIRKPTAPLMEYIGKVLSLQKVPVYGYRTFNSVAVDIAKQGVNLVSHTLYSTAMPDFITQETIHNIADSSTLIQEKVAKGDYINTNVLYQRHIKESSDVLKKDRPGVKICHVSDREFDNNDFYEYITNTGDNFITRLKLSRLSNELIENLTPKGKVSKKKTYQKLLDKQFCHTATYDIIAVEIKGKTYHNVSCVLEWDKISLNEKEYSVVKIVLWHGNKTIFDTPMLLITNKLVNNMEAARAIYKGYILRFKIEVVFRFLKQNIGWEEFQIRDFESIKNLLAIAFFLVGYFEELKEELQTHPLATFLCQIARSKEKITLFYLLQGLEKLVHFQQISRLMEENNITKEKIDDLIKQYNSHL